MSLNLTAEEVLETTRSVRKRLDLDRPVPKEVILECLDLALQAPSGSNSQGWQWMVVSDQAKKTALAELYKKSFDVYAQGPGREFEPSDIRAKGRDAVVSSATYLSENFDKVPYMVIPLIEGRLGEGTPTMAQAGAWGSILPATWSLMLALRSKGLGSAWTTLHLAYEKEAAEILGVPYDQYTQAGLFPVAYTVGTDFKPAKRLPASELIHWDNW
jgi:nitroreductase